MTANRISSRRVEADVAVIGGGPAGMAAAIAAARSGARVALIERGRRLGGLVASAGVDTICGLYRFNPAEPPRFLNENGFAREFAERLSRENDLKPFLAGTLYVLPCPPECFMKLADTMIEEADVGLFLNASAVSIEREGRVIAALYAQHGTETIEIRAKSFVDASGRAIVAALFGERVRDLAASQAAGYLIRIDGAPHNSALAAMRIVARAAEAGRLSAEAACVSIAPWSAPCSLALKFTLAAETTLDRAQENARLLLERLRIEPEWRSAKIGWLSDEIGARGGGAIVGRATLTRSDVLRAAKFPNAAARGAWPIEIWTPGNPRPLLEFPPENDHYQIPADCLLPVAVDNLVAAGRCISADAGAMASARVIATALETGWKAGKMALTGFGGGLILEHD